MGVEGLAVCCLCLLGKLTSIVEKMFCALQGTIRFVDWATSSIACTASGTSLFVTTVETFLKMWNMFRFVCELIHCSKLRPVCLISKIVPFFGGLTKGGHFGDYSEKSFSLFQSVFNASFFC